MYNEEDLSKTMIGSVNDFVTFKINPDSRKKYEDGWKVEYIVTD